MNQSQSWILSPEQRLFLRLILLGRQTWDRKSLYAIQTWLKAEMSLGPLQDQPPQAYPVLCVGCLNSHPEEPETSYPIVIERCPHCDGKPLAAYNDSRVWPGVAKLYYIEQSMHFPTIRLRNQAIHEATRSGARNQAIHEALRSSGVRKNV